VPVLPVFKWLATEGGIAELEMLRTFNCGIGMIAIVGRDNLVDVMRVLTDAGENAVHLGEVVAATSDNRVAYDGHLDLAL
jgi:phosphoribosylformylglycinamidine cyclo-ligase